MRLRSAVATLALPAASVAAPAAISSLMVSRSSTDAAGLKSSVNVVSPSDPAKLLLVPPVAVTWVRVRVRVRVRVTWVRVTCVRVKVTWVRVRARAKVRVTWVRVRVRAKVRVTWVRVRYAYGYGLGLGLVLG